MIGKTIQEISADIRKCDFRGCTVFGKFQNSKAKLEYTEENLPKDYMNRLLDFRVPDSAVLTTDDLYIAMMDGLMVKGMNGLEKVRQMVDYNLVDLKEKIWNYRSVIHEHRIDISYTGAFLYQYGLESIGKENYYIDLDGRAREAYLRGDIDYVETVFKELDKETKRSLVSLALKDGREKFVRKHKRELSGIQKKYFEAKDGKIKVNEEVGKVKSELLHEYSEAKLVELGIDLMNVETRIREDVIREIYKEGDLDFVQKYLKTVGYNLRNEIFMAEYKKENIDFVYRNFDKMDDGDLKDTIVRKEMEAKNFEFLYEKYPYINNKEVKEKIMNHAYEAENIDFLNEHINDMSKNMKLEAAIKFKDLKLSKAEKVALLKK